MNAQPRLDIQSSPCKYCEADRPFTLEIPGLDGNKCKCGIWIGQCPDCSKWRSELLKTGICSDCSTDRELVRAESLRYKRKGRQVIARNPDLVAGGSSNA